MSARVGAGLCMSRPLRVSLQWAQLFACRGFGVSAKVGGDCLRGLVLVGRQRVLCTVWPVQATCQRQIPVEPNLVAKFHG